MKSLLIDAHCDLAWNMLSFGRDYTRAAAETRALEKGSVAVEVNGDTLIGWPDYQRAHAAIVFSTLFAAPRRSSEGAWDRFHYSNAEEARTLYRDQISVYHRLTESKPEYYRLIRNLGELDDHMAQWNDPAQDARPVGLVILMEGADGIRSPDDLPEWHELGLRLIGLSWAGTRYAGGTREPGPLTEDGHRLLRAMSELGFVLDLSHMDERAALEALEVYEGPIVASHVNCLALLPGFPTNRHFSDQILRRIVERGGVIGNVPVNSFLKSGWARNQGSRRDEVPLDAFAAHLDHVCQLAGNSLHSGIGSDFDGGFGVQSVPPEIDTIADLQKLAPLLEARGYSRTDVENILGLNWLRFLRGSLPILGSVNAPSASSTPVTGRPLAAELSTARMRAGLAASVIGLFIFSVGAKPDWFAWDRSPVVGFVQIAVFLVGLGIICLGGYIGLLALWKGHSRTIAADIGLRVVSTGYVISVFAGMADVFGMGSQPLPGIPYFGPWQATGVFIGEIVIAIGFIMLIPYHSFFSRR